MAGTKQIFSELLGYYLLLFFSQESKHSVGEIALNSKQWAFGSFVRLQDFLFLDETGTDIQSPKGCTWRM